ncbi:hypothetical protein PAXRUDRAFT_176964, partial [Paxillus rubicundulus Ve08.2h10]
MQPILAVLEGCNITAAEFITSLLTDHKYKDELTNDLTECAANIFNAFLKHPAAQDKTFQLGLSLVKNTYLREMRDLACAGGGWHFGALSMRTKDLENFHLDNMAQEMEATAPKLWRLFGSLQSEEEAKERVVGDEREGEEMILADEPDDEAYWDELDPLDLKGFIDSLTGGKETHALVKERQAKHCAAIKSMKKIIIISILMQSTNQKANALQSILGIFLQSAHAPQKVIDTLARLGVSISTDSINLAVQSLSVESQTSLRALRQSFLASYAYDNFDVDLKSEVLLAEKSSESLKHLTSGLIFPLSHGISADDLKCSNQLWTKSPPNPHASNSDLPPRRGWRDLVNLHLESADSELSHHDQFNAWMFLNDLCTYGPEYFHQFKPIIRSPDPIEQISLTKTQIFAARAMDVNNSTVNSNI